MSTGQGLNSLNMFAYCENNPVRYVDITGALHVKGTDGCSSVVHYSSFSIGFDTYYSVVDDKTTIDSLFFGEEEGETYTIVADSAQSDDIILFNQIAYNSDSLFEQMFGINININTTKLEYYNMDLNMMNFIIGVVHSLGIELININ